MSELIIPVNVNGRDEQVRFVNFPLLNNRKAYDIELLLGVDGQHLLSSDVQYPAKGTIECTLLEFVKTGDPSLLDEHGLKVVENPGKSVISRNITLLDPTNLVMYVVGSIGLVKFDKEKSLLTLEDPILEDSFGNYQKKHNRNPGGVVYISDDGVVGESNATPLGVSYAEAGPYSLVKKVEKTEKVKKAGITTPDYLYVGKVRNLGDGGWGFSVYKTPIQPDYLMNLKLYLDRTINLTPLFLQYLKQKYASLKILHDVVGCSHGQPTIENAGGLIVFDDLGVGSGACVLKDMDTLKPLPSSKRKTIVEGPCPYDIGVKIRKSPFVAAQTYDLQLALTQELNILLIASQQIPKVDVRLQFVQHQFAIILTSVCEGYGINSEKEIPQILGFCFRYFVQALKQGLDFNHFNEVLGGLCANAIFGLSARYRDQIEVV